MVVLAVKMILRFCRFYLRWIAFFISYDSKIIVNDLMDGVESDDVKLQ
jgi:hypothetical protein